MEILINEKNYTLDELNKEVIEMYREDEINDTIEDMDNKITKFEEQFAIWKTKIDKIMKDNNIDRLYSEREFYDHLVYIVKEIKNGISIRNIFGNADDMENEPDDYNIIHYSQISDIIYAMNNCYYSFEEDAEGKYIYIDMHLN